MPPKGWRKNADGNYPQPNKDADYVSIDEILFPRSIIQKLAKDIINAEESDSGQMLMAKDSLLALQRSATVFVSHMMFHAKSISKEQDRKTVNAQDIISALEKSEYSGFIPEVKHKLTLYDKEAEVRKKKKAEKSTDDNLNMESEQKRLKTDSEEPKPVNNNKSDNSDEEEEEYEEEDIAEQDKNNTHEAEENSNNDDDDDDEEEEQQQQQQNEQLNNPISALSKEDDELQGNVSEHEDNTEPRDDDTNDADNADED